MSENSHLLLFVTVLGLPGSLVHGPPAAGRLRGLAARGWLAHVAGPGGDNSSLFPVAFLRPRPARPWAQGGPREASGKQLRRSVSQLVCVGCATVLSVRASPVAQPRVSVSRHSMWVQGGMKTWGSVCSQATTGLDGDPFPSCNGHILSHHVGCSIVHLTGPR